MNFALSDIYSKLEEAWANSLGENEDQLSAL